MSYFNYPRINFSGSVTINVGTVNNDDYSAGGTYIAQEPGKGAIFRLSDSVNVQPITYGMTDDEFITWAQNAIQTQDVNGQPKSPQIPGEWNYYGDMGVTFNNVQVLSIDNVNGQRITSGNSLIGTLLSFNNDAGRSTALICDVNPEDVPSSQIIADVMSLRDTNGNALFQGPPSKAVTRWINFFRNANLTASAGASGVFQHVIPIDDFTDPGVQDVLKSLGMDTTKLPANLKGFVVRYAIYKTIPPITKPPGNSTEAWDEYNSTISKLYTQPYPNNQNPGIADVSGTIGLWYEGEMQSITMGRYLSPTPALSMSQNQPNVNGVTFSTAPYQANNGGGNFPLGATVIRTTSSGQITIDISNTFPEVTNGDVTTKLSFASANSASTVALGVIAPNADSITYVCSLSTYDSMAEYLESGGMMDITLPNTTDADKALIAEVNSGTLVMYLIDANTTPVLTLLTECDYMIASDQAAVYAEQNQPTNTYRNDANELVPCCFTIFYKGAPITSAVTLYVQESQTTPNDEDQLTGYNQVITVQPTQNNTVPLTLTVDRPGNFLYRISLKDSATITSPPPATGTTDMAPLPVNPISSYNFINLGTDFYVNLRVLPQDDFSAYLNADGTAKQTIPWDYLYDKVLRYYNLIFPAMGLHVPFTEKSWIEMAAVIYQRVDPAMWPSVLYMPRTRDLSETRRQLIRAWCKQYMPS